MLCILLSFFFNDTATTEIYTLSLHDALPIYRRCPCPWRTSARCALVHLARDCTAPGTSDTDRHDGGRAAPARTARRARGRPGAGLGAERRLPRSEERRVGEEGRSRWSPDH